MKQHEVKQERTLNGNTFYVRPFGAFKAANMSGEILSLLTPVLAGVAPIIAGAEIQGDNVTLLDMDAEKAAPHLAKAMDGINGDKLEALLLKLLIQYKNISVQLDGENEAQLLTRDLADEVFCGDTQDMFILAFDVIKVNYAGFFKRLGGQFGEAIKGLLEKA
jgi:hypothetical protein